MNKFIITFFSIVPFIFLVNSRVKAQNVTIPDSAFKAALVANVSINTNGDIEIQTSEAQAYSGGINVSHSSVSNLTGIEAFTSLTELSCEGNSLTSIDISSNTALTKLYLSNNSLTSLDVSNNTDLVDIFCSNNQLTSLVLSSNTSLVKLGCSDNSLTSLDISDNTALEALYCSDNSLTSLDLDSNLVLKELDCTTNSIASLDLSNHVHLKELTCFANSLTSLKVDGCLVLELLRCYDNQLTSLDVSTNIALNYFTCNKNQLTSLDLSNNTSLETFSCEDNQLTSLNVRNGYNTSILVFYAQQNPNLTCIEVDSISYSEANWLDIDTVASFNTVCNTSVFQVKNIFPKLKAYPNPTNKKITLEFGDEQKSAKVTILNAVGKTIFENIYINIAEAELTLDGAVGIYFVRLQTEEGERTLKVLKN